MRDRATRWSPPKRLLFLIMAVFLGFTAAPILLALLPWIGDVFPPAYQAAWNVIVVWLGEHVLGLPEPITILPNSSGDTTWNYVQMFGIVMISLIVGSAWTVVDHARDDCAAVHHWLRVLVRYALSGALLVYGLVKLFCLQFPEPSLATLTQTYGEASPHGLAWTFLGHSSAYNVFAGGAEVLAASLLLARRTATLGALVAIGVLANVIAVNFCFDVCVKLFSMTLMVMALYVFADDLGRFVDAMVRNRATAPAELRPHFVSKVGRRVHVAVKGAWILLCLLGTVHYWSLAREHHAAPKPALHGLYDVESFTSGGVARPPLVGDELRWRHFIVEAHGGAVVRTLDDKREGYALAVDEAERSFTLTLRKDDREQVYAFKYEQPTPDSLVLHGSLGAGPLDIRLRRVDASSFLLVSRGFHWVNEYPLNR